jgi:hypothetical protein
VRVWLDEVLLVEDSDLVVEDELLVEEVELLVLVVRVLVALDDVVSVAPVLVVVAEPDEEEELDSEVVSCDVVVVSS